MATTSDYHQHEERGRTVSTIVRTMPHHPTARITMR
jgi:hypothetical protein